jgi:hypothetical protein
VHSLTWLSLAQAALAFWPTLALPARARGVAALLALASRYPAGALLTPVLQIPNFFCNLVTLIKPWVAGSIMLGLLATAAGFGLRFVLPEASMHLMNGLKGIGVALFIAGIALTPASLTAIATMFGAGSLTFCP